MNRNRLVYRADSGPKEPDNEFGVEVESPCRPDRLHYANGGLKWVKPKPKERIVHATPKRLKVDKPVSNLASLHSFRRGIRSKHGHPENHCVRVIG
jgi:hypothetical protein